MSGPPFVSVVVPARDEGRTIGDCLRAVLAQDYPADRMEVILADGMSGDATRAIASEAARGDRRLTIIDNPERIVPTAMNRAIARAAGAIIVRVDGHTIVAPDYVRRCVETLERTGSDGAGGVMRPAGDTPFRRGVALATSQPFGVGDSDLHYADSEREADSVYLGAYRRATFDRFGGYNERMVRNQDDELNYRIRAAGGRIVLNPAIRSTYTPRGDPAALFSQYFQYGRWKVPVLARAPSMIAARHLVPAAFVLGTAGALGVAAARPSLWPLPAGLLGLHAALSAGFAATAVRRAVPEGGAAALAGLAMAPLATLLVHAGYGLGLLSGLAARGGSGP